jgi:hypothetical protein
MSVDEPDCFPRRQRAHRPGRTRGTPRPRPGPTIGRQAPVLPPRNALRWLRGFPLKTSRDFSPLGWLSPQALDTLTARPGCPASRRPRSTRRTQARAHVGRLMNAAGPRHAHHAGRLPSFTPAAIDAENPGPGPRSAVKPPRVLPRGRPCHGAPGDRDVPAPLWISQLPPPGERRGNLDTLRSPGRCRRAGVRRCRREPRHAHPAGRLPSFTPAAIDAENPGPGACRPPDERRGPSTRSPRGPAVQLHAGRDRRGEPRPGRTIGRQAPAGPTPGPALPRGPWGSGRSRAPLDFPTASAW